MIDPSLSKILENEKHRQKTNHVFIASENFASKEVASMVGSEFSNKYCEGYPGKRYYNGCKNFDDLEKYGNKLVRDLYGASFSNIQPHSGANANLAVFKALLKPGDTTLGMNLTDGGHLSHGSKANISGQWFNANFYSVGPDGFLNYDEIFKTAKKLKPKLIIAGASAYPRVIDWAAFRDIARATSAYLLIDMAHYSGLIAAGCYPNPVKYADVVTSTTHKTLRGARGGMILWNNPRLSRTINSAVFPGVQGGPLMNQIAGKTQSFWEASKPEFKKYGADVITAARCMVEIFKKNNVKVITNGTDSHIVLLQTEHTTGHNVANALEQRGIIVNKNTVPNDKRSVIQTSGIRIGTAAEVTRRGFDRQYFETIAETISEVIREGE